jgi:hypothetical protein
MGRSDDREKLVGHAYSSNLAKNGTLENGFLGLLEPQPPSHGARFPRLDPGQG